MHDLDKIAADFLKFTPATRMSSTKRALEVLLSAYKEGAIYNAAFQDAKKVVDRTFETVWNASVATDFTTYWMPDKVTVSPRGIINNELGIVSGVRNALTLTKKVAKLKVYDPIVDTIKEILAAVVPLAAVIEELKTKIIKGRKPDPEVTARRAAQTANKTVKTCGCCFRPIAVLSNGRIADHGYTMPHAYGKNGSCPGRLFAPLEVSSDGLKYMIDAIRSRITKVEELIRKPPDTLHKHSFSMRKGLGEPVTKTSPDWDIVLKQYIGNLKTELRYTQDDLKSFETKLAHWKPAVTEMRQLISTLAQLVG